MTISPLTTLQATPDEDLAARARAGSAEAFGDLARRYQVPLLRFLQRRAPAHAEDLLQEAFLRAFQAIGGYRPGRPFKPWLFTIAYRLAVDAARRTPRAAMAWSAAADADGGPDAATSAERAEAADHLWAAVRRTLGDDAFTAVWLHYADGLPPRQVAAVMGRSAVWARTTLHRARRELAVTLATTAAGAPGRG